MRYLHYYKNPARNACTFSRTTSLILPILMVIPLFSGVLLFTSEESSGAIGSEDRLYWPQFQRSEERDAVYHQAVRGIDDPVVKWDLGLNVVSMGTTAADFGGNIPDEDGYNRDVVHLLFCAENEDGNTTIYIVDGDTGESAWELDMSSATIEAGPVTGYVNNNDELDIVFASSDGIVYAYEPTIGFDPDQGEGDRYQWEDFNIQEDKLWAYATEDEILDVSPLLTDLTPSSGDSSMDVVISTRLPDSDTQSKVYALEGNTLDSSGAKIWERELEGELPSSPSSLEDGGNSYIWIACYADDDEKEYLYSLKGKDGVIWKTITEKATRGYWDLFIPSPVISDIDGDDELDIVFSVPMDPSNNEEYGSVYVYNLFGEPLDGWKYGVSIKGRIGATPVVGDLRGDGKQYIVIQAWYFSGTTDASTVVTALKRDGSKLWSEEFNTDSDTLEDRAVSSPVLFDLDQNGKLDVIAATNPRIYAFNGSDRSYMEGFSPGMRLNDDIHQLYDSPAIGDFNNDGIFDLVIDSVLITQEIAELEAGDLRFSNDHPEAGEKITIIADVYNNGTADTGNVIIRFLDDNSTIKEDTYTIRAGQTADPIPRVQDYQVSEGWHTFTVVVDPDNEVEEVNKSNNVYSRTIFVAAPYDFTADAPILERSSLPERTAKFPVQIENIGTKQDRYTFEGMGLPDSWDFEVTGPLEGDGSLKLESRETGNISVDVHIPKADAHTSQVLTLNISSSHIEKTIQYDLRVNVLQDHDVRLDVVGSDVKRVTPGNEVSFELEIINTGNGMDNFTLSRETPPDDWIASFNIININNVLSGRPRTAFFTLTAPEIEDLTGNNQVAEITITVTSKDNASASEDVVVRAEIAQLAVDEDYLAALPGENATYTILIFNKDEDDNTVTLEKKSGDKEWPFEFSETEFIVPGRSKVEKTLNISVPVDADPKSVNTFLFEAYFQEQVVTEEETVRTEAKQKFEVEITSFTNLTGGDVTKDHLLPGDSRDYKLTFMNRGNWYDSYIFTADLPDGWSAVFTPSEITDMVRNTSRTVTLTLTTSEDEWAFANHTITLTVMSTLEETDGSVFDTFDLAIGILRVRGVSLELNGTVFPILPEETVHITVTVRNTGNWFENFTLELDIPLGMSSYNISLDMDKHAYDPLEEKIFPLAIEAPHALDPEVREGLDHIVNASVSSGDGSISDGMDAHLTVEQFYLGRITGDLVGSMKPSQTMDVDFTLTNLGNGRDTFRVEAINFDGDWQMSLMNDSAMVDSFLIDLEPGESWDFILRIESPPASSLQAKAGFITSTGVVAVSESDLPFYRIVETHVEQVYSASIHVGMNGLRVIPGESVNYTLTIRNTGNGNDNITIRNSNPQEYWELRIIGGRSFPLGYGDLVTRTLQITAPDTDSDPYFGMASSILIEVVSDDDPLASEPGNVTVNTWVSYVMPVGNLFLISPDSTKDIPFYIMDVEGTGSNLRIDCFTVSPWKVRFKSGGGTYLDSLTSYERKTIYLTVTAPSRDQTVAGDRASVWVDLIQPEEDNNISVTMEVKAVFEFNVSAVKETVRADQGSSMRFSLDITNIGNVDDIYTFQFILPYFEDPDNDWNGTLGGLESFSEGDEVSYYISLEPRDIHRFHLDIQLPDYVKAGNYSVLVAIASDHGEKEQILVNAVINPFYSLEIDPRGTIFNVKDGNDVTIEIDIRNTGNAKDDISLFVTNLPLGWNSLFSPTSFTFPEQTEKSVSLILSVPSGTPTADHDLTIQARSDTTGNSSFGDVTVSVKLQDKPDLTVASIRFSPESPREGDKVTITAEISNIGNAVARDVVVQFFVDGKLLGEESISTISATVTTPVSTGWEPDEGEYTIKVVVDPANDINEKDDTNNERTVTQSVDAPQSSGGVKYAAILLVLVLLGVALFRTKPWDKEQHEGIEGNEDQDSQERPFRQKQKEVSMKDEEIDYTKEKQRILKKHEVTDPGWDEDPAVEEPAPIPQPKPRITMEEAIFPVILNCPKCKKKIRIIQEGKFRCPNCSNIGRVDETGEIMKGTKPKIAPMSWDDEPQGKEGAGESGEWGDSGDDSSRDWKGTAGAIRTRDSTFPMKYICEDCGKRSTVEKPGWYKCPFCGSVHDVDEDGEVDNIQERDRTREKEENDWTDRDRKEAPEYRTRLQDITGESDEDMLPDTGHPGMMTGGIGPGTGEHAAGSTRTSTDALEPGQVTTYPAVVVCPNCEAKVRVQKKGTYRCPSCRDTFPVGKTSELTSNCPWCGVTVRVRKPGDFNCPSCSERFSLQPDGRSAIHLTRNTKKEWRENRDKPVSLNSMWTVLSKFIPDLRRSEIENIHKKGFRSLDALKSAQEIDLALAGMEAERANMLKAEIKKF